MVRTTEWREASTSLIIGLWDPTKMSHAAR
jgi:hypothetical protein